MTQKLDLNELWITFGTATSLRYLKLFINCISYWSWRQESTTRISRFDGMDRVHGLWRSNLCFPWISNYPDDATKECLRKLERFVVLLYNRTSAKIRVNEARRQLFTQNGNLLNLYPLRKLLLSSIPGWTFLLQWWTCHIQVNGDRLSLMQAGHPTRRHCQTCHHLGMSLLNVAARKFARLTAYSSEWPLSAFHFAFVVDR